jgi:hypothetical protein
MASAKELLDSIAEAVAILRGSVTHGASVAAYIARHGDGDGGAELERIDADVWGLVAFIEGVNIPPDNPLPGGCACKSCAYAATMWS